MSALHKIFGGDDSDDYVRDGNDYLANIVPDNTQSVGGFVTNNTIKKLNDVIRRTRMLTEDRNKHINKYREPQREYRHNESSFEHRGGYCKACRSNYRDNNSSYKDTPTSAYLFDYSSDFPSDSIHMGGKKPLDLPSSSSINFDEDVTSSEEKSSKYKPRSNEASLKKHRKKSSKSKTKKLKKPSSSRTLKHPPKVEEVKQRTYAQKSSKRIPSKQKSLNRTEDDLFTLTG